MSCMLEGDGAEAFIEEGACLPRPGELRPREARDIRRLLTVHKRTKPAAPTSRVRLRGRRGTPMLLATALEVARIVDEALAGAGLPRPAIVGEVRRGCEIVRELLLIVPGPTHVRALVEALEKAPACEEVTVRREATIRMRFDGAGPAVLRVIPPARFVETLVRATGSARHVRGLESLAARAGGLRAVCGQVRDERALYARLGVPFAPPELREGWAPGPKALAHAVHGIFHVHTTWSDGSATIEEMARAAAREGFAYLGISDHSKAATYARGLDSAQLNEQARAVAQARLAVPGIAILHGVEVDILPDGSLDLDDVTLARLDFVIASVHTSLDMPADEMTARVLRAVCHPLVTILGHPTGRLLLGRAGCALDIEAVAMAAAGNDTFLEINANPQRLDLSDALAKQAAARGARFAIDPDAHSVRGVRDTTLGLTVARRAGLQTAQILNARQAPAAVAYLADRRARAMRKLQLA